MYGPVYLRRISSEYVACNIHKHLLLTKKHPQKIWNAKTIHASHLLEHKSIQQRCWGMFLVSPSHTGLQSMESRMTPEIVTTDSPRSGTARSPPIHVPCPGAFHLWTPIPAKHDDLRYFWVLHLIVNVMMLYMTGDLFDEMIETPWKSAITHSDPGSRVPQDLQDLGHFSRNFGLAKDIIESGMKGGCKRHKLQQK